MGLIKVFNKHIKNIMSNLIATMNNIEDPDKLESLHGVSKAIHEMDEEVRDRFKALKVIYDSCQEFEDEMQTEVRNIEVLYQELYREVDN